MADYRPKMNWAPPEAWAATYEKVERHITDELLRAAGIPKYVFGEDEPQEPLQVECRVVAIGGKRLLGDEST